MNKKIIYILVFLVCVSLVSASVFRLKLKRESKELVTCGDFSCNTDWVGLPDAEGTSNRWVWDSLDNQAQFVTDPFPEGVIKFSNFSQILSIKSNSVYNVTVQVDDTTSGTNQMNLSLGGVKKVVFTNLEATGDTIFSFDITTITTQDLNITATVPTGIAGNKINLDSISVKEIKHKFKWKLKTKNNNGIFRWKLKRS